MRSYCGVYVDAGYLTATASLRLTGTSYRAATEVDVASLLTSIVDQAIAHSGLPLLRVHWYDAAARGVASHEQRRIATLPRVKLRLGRTSVHGEQKGVDLKLALDLITQARNRVTDVVYLVSGDDDLTEAVEEAQHLGTQIVLLAVPDADGRPINVSRNLQMACDEMVLLRAEALDEHVRTPAPAPADDVRSADVPSGVPVAAPSGVPSEQVPSQPTPTPAASPSGERPRVTPAMLAARAEHRAPAAVPPKRLMVSPPVPIYSSTSGQPPAGTIALPEEVETAVGSVVASLLHSWWTSATPLAKQELRAAQPIVPPDLDRTLLLDLSARLHVDDLDVPTRYRLREAFWEHLARL